VEDGPAVRRACILIGFVRDVRRGCTQWPPDISEVVKELKKQGNVTSDVAIKEQTSSDHSILVWAAALVGATVGDNLAGAISKTCGITRGTVLTALKRAMA